MRYIFPFISTFKILIESLKPYFCRHQMRYWDMKWRVDDKKSHFYKKFNGILWTDSFCECQKCGVKYSKVYRALEFGWEKSDFTPTKGNVIEVEIFEFGKMSKSQKRENTLNDLLN
jgi:hypothetical protein